MVLVAAPSPRAQRVAEHELKAAFLYNFTKFVEWPPDTFPDDGAAFRICVVGDEAVGTFLEALVALEAVQGRRIEVQRHAWPRDAEGCQILFVSATAEAGGLTVLPDPQENAVLTVGESDRFLAAGGMVRLRLGDGRSRIEISDPARARSTLKLSSKLLQLCDLVRPALGEGA